MKTGILHRWFRGRQNDDSLGWVLNALMEGVMVVDGAGDIVYVNASFAKIFSLTKHQLLRKNISSFALEKDHLLHRCFELIKMVQHQRESVTDAVVLEKDNGFVDLIVTPHPSRKDVTLIAEKKLNRDHTVELGKEFLSNAAHELRTPMAIVWGFAEMFTNLSTISSAMRTEIAEKIVRNCQRMNTIVKNLLTLADLEHVPESRFHPCDIVAVAHQCKQMLLAIAAHAKVQIESSEESMIIDADSTLLELALMNLLENGVKYSRNIPQLTIQLKMEGNDAIIIVQDQGVGISAQDLPHIFDRFYAVDKKISRKLGGTGLGLSIVKTIIEKHDGVVTVASTPGEGTAFTVKLPCHRKVNI